MDWTIDSRLRHALVVLAFIVGASTLASITTMVVDQDAAHAAVTAQVINTDGQGVSSRNAPRLDARNGYGASEGAQVVANCWTWGESVGPNNNRLWWLITHDGRTFYAPDRYLSTPNVANTPPPGEPQCGEPIQGSSPALQGSSPCLQGGCTAPQGPSPADRAVEWTLTKLGQVSASPDDAVAYSDWTPGPYGEWSGDCVKFVHRAYAVNGVDLPRGDALAIYWAYASEGRIQTDTPPAGALVFWDTARPYGHIAVSAGGGEVIGTRGMDGDGLPISQYGIGTIPGYLGWAMP